MSVRALIIPRFLVVSVCYPHCHSSVEVINAHHHSGAVPHTSHLTSEHIPPHI
jgi:hypothetical protein